MDIPTYLCLFFKAQLEGTVNDPYFIGKLKAVLRRRKVPPSMPKRNVRGPFLLKCCRVVYNEETNRLELPAGEFIGDAIQKDANEEDEKSKEYRETAIDLENDDNDLSGMSN